MNNLFRKPVQTQAHENRYHVLGFKYNPFPVDPAVKPNSLDERENGSIYMASMRQEEIDKFKEIVISSESRINLLMDYAAYRGRGIGKTAFLNYIRKQINKDLGDEFTNGQQVLYAVYVNPGGEKKERKFSFLSRLIYDAIVKEDLLLITFCRLRANSGLIPDALLQNITSENLKETLGSNDWLRENGIDVRNIDRIVEEKIVSSGVSLFDTNHPTLFPSGYLNFQTAFSPENLEKIWKARGASIVFNELVRLFKAAEFSNIILLFDEAEKVIISQNFGERREFCDNLRYYFIDGSNDNANRRFYKLLMTIHPNSQELLLTHWNAAGLDRFSILGGEGAIANTIFFRPLKDKKMAVLLAKAYIERAKLDSHAEESGQELLPFNEQALETAIEISEGIPGKFLKLLYNAVELALTEKATVIDRDMINNIWKKISDVEYKKPIYTSEQLPESKNIFSNDDDT